MSTESTFASFPLHDMIAEYRIEQPSKAVSLRLYPAALEGQLVEHRATLHPHNIPAWLLEPLVQFKLLGDPTGEYTQGLTMRNSATLSSLRLEDQQVLNEGGTTTIITRLASERGYAAEHHLRWHAGDPAVADPNRIYQPFRSAPDPGNAGQFLAERHFALCRG